MDKKVITVEELLKELRLKHMAYLETCSPTAGQIFADAADALEQMREREKFHVFVWKTLGYAKMRQLEEMYHQLDEEGEGCRWTT